MSDPDPAARKHDHDDSTGESSADTPTPPLPLPHHMPVSEWSPAVWTTLKLAAMSLTAMSTPEHRARILRFIHDVAWILPCGSCRTHYLDALEHGVALPEQQQGDTVQRRKSPPMSAATVHGGGDGGRDAVWTWITNLEADVQRRAAERWSSGPMARMRALRREADDMVSKK